MKLNIVKCVVKLTYLQFIYHAILMEVLTTCRLYLLASSNMKILSTFVLIILPVIFFNCRYVFMRSFKELRMDEISEFSLRSKVHYHKSFINKHLNHLLLISL